MDELYRRYKNRYIALKRGGDNKKCIIDKTDRVLFGDGGSSAIIVISNDKKVYKIFTLYHYDPDIKLEEHIKEDNEKIDTEINIYMNITKNIIDKKICSHFVRYISSHECVDADKLFDICPKYVDFMKIDDNIKPKMCVNYYKNYPERKINNNYRVIELEYCNYSCTDFIKDISKLPEIFIEQYLDIFFFQIIYSIVSIQQVYPYFTHNDLFMRNILGLKEKDNNNFYEYEYNKKIYYVPVKRFYPKINDFGMSNLDDKNKNTKLYKSDYKDIYNILFDVYNGGNLGSMSLTELCKDNPDKIKFIKDYFSTFFDVNIIDEYKLRSRNEMNWNWSNILDQEYLDSIKIKKPSDLLDNYFYNIFSKMNKKIDKFI